MSEDKKESKFMNWLKSIGMKYYYVSMGARSGKNAMTSYAILKSRSKYPPLDEPIKQTEDLGYTNTQIFCATRVSKRTAEWITEYNIRGARASKESVEESRKETSDGK